MGEREICLIREACPKERIVLKGPSTGTSLFKQTAHFDPKSLFCLLSRLLGRIIKRKVRLKEN